MKESLCELKIGNQTLVLPKRCAAMILYYLDSAKFVYYDEDAQCYREIEDDFNVSMLPLKSSIVVREQGKNN